MRLSSTPFSVMASPGFSCGESRRRWPEWPSRRSARAEKACGDVEAAGGAQRAGRNTVGERLRHGAVEPSGPATAAEREYHGVSFQREWYCRRARQSFAAACAGANATPAMPHMKADAAFTQSMQPARRSGAAFHADGENTLSCRRSFQCQDHPSRARTASGPKSAEERRERACVPQRLQNRRTVRRG